jgi:uncharacterized membrane protein YkoI
MWAKTLLLAAGLAITSMAVPGFGGASSAQSVQPGWMVPVQDRGERPANILSLREIVDIVRSQHGGELLSARLEQGQRPVYVLRWRLPNNDVTDFRVDAASGHIR